MEYRLYAFLAAAVWASSAHALLVDNLKNSLFTADEESFIVTAAYAYTAKGWNYSSIDESILEENLDYISSTPVPSNPAERTHISVFPEHAFVTTEVINNRSLAFTLAQRVPEPNPNVVPCVVNSLEPEDLVVKRMSCLSRSRYAFIVIGVLEKVECVVAEECRDDGVKIYSTTVVFGQDGHIEAKYRKFHMIDEPALDAAPTQEFVTFTTANNVTVGLLTGQDLLFREPAATLLGRGVKNFAQNGAWKNTLPFIQAASIERAWAAKNKVFLVAGNYMRAELGYTGIGHFFRDGGDVIGIQQGSGGYVMTEIYINIPARRVDASDEEDLLIGMESQDLEGWASVDVPPSNLAPNQVQVCHGETFCCKLTYRTIRSADNPHYKLIAFDGNRTDSEGNVLFNEQTCGLVACSGAEVTTCGADKKDVRYTRDISFTELTLSGNFSSDQVIPISLQGNENYFPLNALGLSSENIDAKFTVTLQTRGSMTVVHTFGLTSTDYFVPQISGVSKISATSLQTLIATLVFMICNR